MKETSKLLGNSNLTPRQAKKLDDALMPTRFDFFVHRALGRAHFWDKQAVLLAGALLGKVTLAAASGVAAMKGHENAGNIMLGGIVAWNLANILISNKMAKREGLKEIVTGQAEGAPQRSSSRIFLAGALSSLIALAAVHAAPGLSERAYKALYGHAPTQKESQRHAEFFKDIK